MTLDFALARLAGVIDRLVVYPGRMRENLDALGGLIHSQRVLLALVEAGMSREDAYAAVQRNAMAVWEDGGDFLALLAGDAEVTRLLDEDALAAHLIEQAARERWGALGEVGSSFPAMHDDERRMIRAVSQVHQRTGLPIFTHVPHESCPSCAIEQIDLYESAGVDLGHLCIGHLSTIQRSDDPGWETHKEIAGRGAFIGFDTVGHRMSASFIPEREKVDMVLNALEAGYEDHILLSSDFANTAQIKANWGNGFSTVLVQFVPKLRYFGVPEETIRKILVDNPRRWLAHVPGAA